jgi:hypothetical protein
MSGLCQESYPHGVKKWRRCPDQRTTPMWQGFLGNEKMAEDEGFEPSVGCPTHAFQACALGRYANPPG